MPDGMGFGEGRTGEAGLRTRAYVGTYAEARVLCDEVAPLVVGKTLDDVLVAIDLDDGDWDWSLPVLLRAGDRIVLVDNFKLDEVRLFVGGPEVLLDPDAYEVTFPDWPSEVEWRSCPADRVVGRTIRAVRPSVGPFGYVNTGFLAGIELDLGDVSLQVVNGCDENMLQVVDWSAAEQGAPTDVAVDPFKEHLVLEGHRMTFDSDGKRILGELAEVEKTGVRVLLAVESGSRAWGFPSPDSDYDVRFVYVRRLDDYLRLEKERDQLDWTPDERMDLVGWDLSKFLRLMRRSNPSVFEWLASPCVYGELPEFARVREVAEECYDPLAIARHYLGMATSTAHRHLSSEEVLPKKYLYVVRSLLAARWALSRPEPVPVPFAALVDSLLEEELRPLVNELIVRKTALAEQERLPRVGRLDAWVEATSAECREQLVACESETAPVPWERLDEVFRAIVLDGSEA